MSPQEKYDFDFMVSVISRYIIKWVKRPDQRHTKTTIRFVGDRFKVEFLDSHFKRVKNKEKTFDVEKTFLEKGRT